MRGVMPAALQDPNEVGAAGRDIEQDQRFISKRLEAHPFAAGQRMGSGKQNVRRECRQMADLKIGGQVDVIEQGRIEAPATQPLEQRILGAFLEFATLRRDGAM